MLRDALGAQSSVPEKLQGLTPYIMKKVIAAEKLSVGLTVKNWEHDVCEVSGSRSDKWHVVDLSLPVDRGKLCSKGCNLNAEGVCAHVAAAIKAHPRETTLRCRQPASPPARLRPSMYSQRQWYYARH